MVRSWLLLLWVLLDPIYYSFTRLSYIQDQKSNIFRVRITRYKGREALLSDGITIKKNDMLIKIHLHNARLLNDLDKVTCDVTRGRFVFKRVLESLPGLASYIELHPRRDEIKGIIGITTLHKGCRRLGFETYDIKNRYYRTLKQIPFLVISVLSSKNFSKIQKQQPKYLFMSTESLTSRYKVN
ncbi:YkoP family protein [Bacillus suaedaesalsae]|uniref:YkoP-like domain-containing protein n=1 Tax=Bacillus suaedaesalsae TaxID=2810349 RepID=A0ABS2DLF3_9BACI|nr:hypothetical protein [Bacillus suaedaesalsae]MBM6619325.1 hypothetical protein [Bacillus suaedaesalsae]